jgi:hypothetical protein
MAAASHSLTFGEQGPPNYSTTVGEGRPFVMPHGRITALLEKASRLTRKSITLKQGVIGGVAVVALGLVGVAFSSGDVDMALSLIVVVLPTGMGVVCAMQALKPPKPEHHKRWFAFFLGIGLLISATVWYQQYRAAKRADDERQALQTQLNRLLYPIRDVQVSFDLTVSLEAPSVQNYRERLNKCVESIIATQEPQCGVALASGQINVPDARLKDICISPRSELYPVEDLEDAAYLAANHILLEFAIFKNPPIEPLKEPLNPDLFFVARRTLNWDENIDVNGYSYVRFCYDLWARRLYLRGFNIPVDPALWKANGRIVSVPDLSNTTLLVNAQLGMPSVHVTKATLTPNDSANRALLEVARTSQLNWVVLRVSNGFELKVTSEQFRITDGPNGERVYFTNLSQNIVK